MERIRQAVDRAKRSSSPDTQPQEDMALGVQHRTNARAPMATQSSGKEILLNGALLESNRIISHDIADPRSRSVDILRTQVLQSMDVKSWQVLGVTSPTAGCGKTVISVNLALSIARQPERSVLLVDMDLQKPQVANYLGLNCDRGLLSVLEGRTTLSNTIIEASIRNQKILVLPCETSTLRSSEWMASRSMSSLLQEIRRNFNAWTVILDLPPILTSDDVISILPQIDCTLFVVGAGISTVPEIKECNKHLESTSVVRVVLNKSSDTGAGYYSRYSDGPISA